jgi:hypothetical protein
MLSVAVGTVLILFALSTLVFRLGSPPAPREVHLPYTQFVAQVNAGNVSTAVVDDATQDVSGTLRHPVTYAHQTASQYATTVYPYDGEVLRHLLTTHHVTLLPLPTVPFLVRLGAFVVFLIGVAGVALVWFGSRRLRDMLPRPRNL